MNEIKGIPYFGVEGHAVYESPFDAIEAALDVWLSGGEERPDTVRVEVYMEQLAYMSKSRIEDLAYTIAEDLALHEREHFEESMRLIRERLTWAIETCHTGAFIPDLRYLDVRTVGDDDEWEMDYRDEDLLRTWWGMETARMRGEKC